MSTPGQSGAEKHRFAVRQYADRRRFLRRIRIRGGGVNLSRCTLLRAALPRRGHRWRVIQRLQFHPFVKNSSRLRITFATAVSATSRAHPRRRERTERHRGEFLGADRIVLICRKPLLIELHQHLNLPRARITQQRRLQSKRNLRLR